MVNKSYYQTGVPSADTENKRTKVPNKYTVNKSPKGVRISRPVLFLLMAGVMLLLLGAVLVTFFLVPRCTEAYTEPDYQPKEVLADIRSDWDERLPTALRPTHYRIQLMPFIQPGNFTTKGEVTISLNCTEDTERITFHINDIIIHENFLKVTELKENKSMDISIKEFMYEKEKQRLTIVVDTLLLSGNQYEIFIKFTGHLNDLLQGFYRINYYDYLARTERWMAATQFSPTDARRAFPCFDEPAMKAKFTISLARNSSMTTRSNMELKETKPVEEMKGWLWDHYHTTPIMSTYLIAMMVSDLKQFKFENSSSENKLKFSVWSRKEALQQTRYAGLIGPRVLSYFENYFKINFPLPKLDMVALPDFGFNAMENWGLITFREASLLYDESISPIESKRQIATVLSHELGHQWFGNLVTPEWWDDLWLKEGFATYTEYLGVDHVQPTWNILDELVLSEHQASFELDCLTSSHPIYVPVNRTEQIRQIFDTISYSKGASIIRMVNNFLGEYTFKVGLINYLNKHKFANAYHDDLWNVLTTQAHMDGTLDKNITIKEIMDTWILKSGYPVVTVIRDYKMKTVLLKQERFILTGKSGDKRTWWVPISYTTSRESNFANTTPKAWMKNEETISLTNLTENDEWIYVNIREAGYYRVNYDIENWRMLIMNFQNFPHVIRAQLIDDALDLARANLLEYEIPLNMLIEIFKDSEQQYVPLASTFEGLEFLNNMLALSPSYGKYKQFLSGVMERVFKNVGFIEHPEDTYDMQMKRAAVLKWACRLESSDCIIQARHLFRKWMSQEENEPNPITPNLKYVVYCTAIREGGDAEWNFAYQQFLKTNLATEKSVILQSLGCASQPWLLSRYLELILKNENMYSQIRKQDGSAVFQSVAKNVAGNQLAFDFLRKNWKELNEYYGLAFSAISKMVGALPTYMNTKYELSELESFKNEHLNDIGTSERAMEQTIEKVKANVGWMSNSYKKVEEWLDNTIKRFRL